MAGGGGRHHWWQRITRDLASFGLGVFVIVHETLRPGSVRPELLIVGVALIGGPVLYRIDDAVRAWRGTPDRREQPRSDA